ncbi:MAG: hypothetical protein JNM94_05180 [Phycisphaerae bacterium]|nr:hypothetical protein [Phycisphaerae bacterium]
MTRTHMFHVAAVTLTAVASAAVADGFSIEWSSIDAGAGVATSPTFSLVGGFGQSDAAAPIGSETFTVAGGFYAGLGAATTSCPLDLDDDGIVSGADLAILLGSWGPCAVPCAADIDGSGVVDGLDLGSLLGAWGPC